MAAVGLTGIAASVLLLGGCNNGVAETQSAAPTGNTAFESAASVNTAPRDESQPHSHENVNDSELGVHARNTRLEVSMQPRVLVPNKMATRTLRVLDKKSEGIVSRRNVLRTYPNRATTRVAPTMGLLCRGNLCGCPRLHQSPAGFAYSDNL